MPTPHEKLGPVQLKVLRAAAAHKHRMVLPLPAEIGLRGKQRGKVFTRLIRRGLVEEVAFPEEANVWRTDAAGHRFGLRISPLGLQALNAQPTPEKDESQDRSREREEARPDRPAGLLGAVVGALQQECGASIEELIALTKWQPHTIRSALSRLRKRGFAIRYVSDPNRKAYFLG